MVTETRITPAYAGKSQRPVARPAPPSDHPRIRGEKLSLPRKQSKPLGSPPHARGKVLSGLCVLNGDRITPACAGKSLLMLLMATRRRDHPRMRGEKKSAAYPITFKQGLPPHARGKAFRRNADIVTPGITPACAGKSQKAQNRGTRTQDHPRMRGEKLSPLKFSNRK